MFVLTALSAIALPVARARAECPTLSLADDFKRSAAVFVGRAIAQSVVPTPHDARDRATATTFEVEALWKGEPSKTIRIRTCGWTVGDDTMTCGESFTFVVGSRYVVFADGGALETNACHHTAPVNQAAQTLEWLSHKPRKKTASPKGVAHPPRQSLREAATTRLLSSNSSKALRPRGHANHEPQDERKDSGQHHTGESHPVMRLDGFGQQKTDNPDEAAEHGN
jgi:hypothetical protein